MNRTSDALTGHFITPSFLTALLLAPWLLIAQAKNDFTVTSPDSTLTLRVIMKEKLQWSVQCKGDQIIAPSSISLRLEVGKPLGDDAQIISHSVEHKNSTFAPINYTKNGVRDRYSQLTLNFKDGYGLVFRVYDNAVAYRFFTKKKGKITVNAEEASFNFVADHRSFLPFMVDYRGGEIFNSSFEAFYKEISISQFPADSLAFLPVLVDVGHNRKVAILEADLEDYPGMYLTANSTRNGFVGVHAPYPLEAKVGGWAGINYIPTKRAGYIARTDGTRDFPWRAVIVSQQDKELLDNDLVQELASPPRLNDVSWIRPGQVAWDWWNNWNISHVDFRAGLNTPTYKYYIDFAAANNIPYIIMDAGWSEILDLTEVSPDVNVREIVDYGRQKDVGVILWASWYAVTQQMDTVFPLYASTGVKGFKIDFIDRDDQVAVASTYEIAKKAAEHHLIVDYHGIFKPTGLQRTYPNIVGYEGVRGLEYFKWAADDASRYIATIPFIRMLAGPMDYTPGAMRNATVRDFRPVNDMPMNQGTRCQQLAMYVVYNAPLQMLSDNPTAYMKERESTDFITKIPTTFDETVALAGTVGEYAAIARRKGTTWYVGAISNGDRRNLTLDFSFLPNAVYDAVVFEDGVNADRDATDYKKTTRGISSGEKLDIHLSPGGGWAARIEKRN